MKQLEDKSIDLVITDPPYGINNAARRQNDRNSSPVKQKNGTYLYVPKPDYDAIEFDGERPGREYFDEIIRISRNQIIFGGNYFADLLPISSCWVIWDKKNKGTPFSDCELAWTSFDTAVRIFKYRWNGMLQEDMAHKEKRFHPTQKPVKLFEWIIRNYAKPNDIICDSFFGSGACLIAAIRQGHKFIGFEKERVYFDKAQEQIRKAMEQGKISEWF